jgi:ribonuclease HI
VALFSFSVMLSGMITFDQLTAAAYKGERIAGRRLAAREGIAEEAALRRVLELAAAEAGLAGLLTERAALRDALAAHASARNDRKAQALAIKARRHEGPATPWRAWFDGSAHPNPGRCGIGGVIVGPDGQRIEISQAAGFGNSSEAEYLALIAVLKAACEAGADELTVYGDSQGVIEDANGTRADGAVSLGELRFEVRSWIAKIGKVSLRWVPRHKNPEADALSQRAALLR